MASSGLSLALTAAASTTDDLQATQGTEKLTGRMRMVDVAKDPAMLVRYNELKERLTGKRAIIVIARKLVSRIYYVRKNQKPYELGIVN